MDLERIKQNLRLRSGRSKKNRKPVALQLDTKSQSKVQQDRSVPNTVIQDPSKFQKEHTYEPVRDEPSLRNWDDQTALPQLPTTASGPVQSHRPNLPHAATGSNSNISPQKRTSRFGRSGIERPRNETSPTKASPSKPAPLQRTMSETDTGGAFNSDTSDALDFDLRPPPPRQKPPSIESLAESLFSPGHLNLLLGHPQYLSQFTSFVNKYKPEYHPIILRYLETQKAIKAVEYANAVAAGIEPLSVDDSGAASDKRPSTAATFEQAFTDSNSSSFQTLLNSALPMYITYKLVKVVTECLINEIAGRSTPVTADLLGGLSEVFCLTDPNQADNPIIYASKEFYRLTGYGRDDVIGHNCRFLQGTKTSRDSVSRLRNSIKNSEQTCETLLNYRRDGRPFINVLLIAPLHDGQGNVKYHIGAQVDVTRLIEQGKGLDGFERYLVLREIEKRDKEINDARTNGDEQRLRKAKTLEKLRDLSQMFDLEESAVVRSNSRSTSLSREEFPTSTGSSRRRLIGESDSGSGDDDESPGDDNTWKLGQSGQFGLSGKLPGIYDSYMLIRTAPSLRIVFLSPKLRQRFGNVLQHPFLSHVAAPSATLAGLKESFGAGVAVSARINFLLKQGEQRDGTKTSHAEKPEHSRVCWISATPLLGSDDSVGVWMIIVVEKNKVSSTGKTQNSNEAKSVEHNETAKSGQIDRPTKIDIPARKSSHRAAQSHSRQASRQDLIGGDMPIKPKKLEDLTESLDSAESTLRPGTDDDKKTVDIDEKDENKATQKKGLDQKDSNFEALELSSDISEDEGKRSEDQFVRTKSPPQEPQTMERVHIRGDSDGEPEALSTADLDNALTKSLPGSRAGTGMALHGIETPPRSPETLNLFPGFSDDEDTPRHSKHPAFANNITPSPPRHGSDRTNSPADRGASNKRYMDYISHPGSGRASSEYNRALPGIGLVSSMYHGQEGEIWEKDGKDEFSDRECLGSPYSVD